MHVSSQAGGVLVLPRRSWNVTGTYRQRSFVFYLGLCMFSCNITGTWFKSYGLNVQEFMLSAEAKTNERAGNYLDEAQRLAGQ